MGRGGSPTILTTESGTVVGDASEANRRWAEHLAAWAIPEDLVAKAEEPPYFFDPAVFTAAADAALARAADTTSDAVARAALPAGGTVLDVGAGAGTASLRLGAAHAVGVDSNSELLRAFAERASRMGIATTLVEGRWPEVAPSVLPADVVVCHHVAYNAPDLAAFASALDAHARRRVVVELTAVHPMSWMAPYWKALHGLDQPERPTADDAVDVLTGLGFEVHQRRWVRDVQMIGESEADSVARIARRLCLPAARHDELRLCVEANPPPRTREVVTLWWDRRGGS
jgi:SAM-dependent methyltransferase